MPATVHDGRDRARLAGREVAHQPLPVGEHQVGHRRFEEVALGIGEGPVALGPEQDEKLAHPSRRVERCDAGRPADPGRPAEALVDGGGLV